MPQKAGAAAKVVARPRPTTSRGHPRLGALPRPLPPHAKAGKNLEKDREALLAFPAEPWLDAHHQSHRVNFRGRAPPSVAWPSSSPRTPQNPGEGLAPQMKIAELLSSTPYNVEIPVTGNPPEVQREADPTGNVPAAHAATRCPRQLVTPHPLSDVKKAPSTLIGLRFP